jgi:hypothetical protein
MVDLKKVGDFFTQKNLWALPFNAWTEDQMKTLVTVVLSSPSSRVPLSGWVKPFITEAGELIIPAEAHPKYRWWLPDSQSIFETLKEIGAPQSVIDRYVANTEGVPF